MGRLRQSKIMQVLGVAVAAVVLVAVGVTIADSMLASSGEATCPAPQKGNIRTGPDPKFGLVVDTDDKLLLVLDHQVKVARDDERSVRVVDAAKPTDPAELPTGARVGARLTGTPRAAEPLAFPVVTSGKPSDDGQSIVVAACTSRPNRDTKPGRYAARVRVGGPGIVPSELPVEVTIRAGVRSTILLALGAAIVGVLLTHYGTPVQTTLTGSRRRVVLTLAVLVGLAGGLSAAYLAYDGDPTWGAERGKDTVELVIATAAAASAAMSAAGAGAKAAVSALGSR